MFAGPEFSDTVTIRADRYALPIGEPTGSSVLGWVFTPVDPRKDSTPRDHWGNSGAVHGGARRSCSASVNVMMPGIWAVLSKTTTVVTARELQQQVASKA